MHNYLTFLIIYFSTVGNLLGQSWMDPLTHQRQITDLIKQNKDWETIKNRAKHDFNIESKYLNDINSTIEFLESIQPVTALDSFFIDVCLTEYKYFPYRMSGHLNNRLYTIPKISSTDIVIPPPYDDSSIYIKIARLNSSNNRNNIADLIKYLNNDSATRQIIGGLDWDEPPFYLSISDIAIELIEVLTLCDFFDNASQRDLLFSNLEDTSRLKIVTNISDWYKATSNLSTTESVRYFLDNYVEIGYSYTYTCKNLLFIGDTVLAIEKFQYYYELLELPCRSEIEVGKILLELGDRRVYYDCCDKLYNYRCMVDNARECVKIILEDHTHYKDNLLAELISTEPFSNYRKNGSGPGYVWHTVFSELANYDKNDIPQTLVALMKIKDVVKNSGISGKRSWERKHPKEIESDFRVCDFALLKFNELIEPLEIEDWMDIEQRDAMIQKLIAEYGD